MYEKNKGRVDLYKTWKGRVWDKKDQKRKGYKPNIVPIIENNLPWRPIIFEGSKGENSTSQMLKFTLQCWNYGGEHFSRDFPTQKKLGPKVHQV